MGGLCIATSLHHVNGVVVITAIASVFIILFIHYLVIFDFAILFHKVSKPVTEGYPDFYESEIYLCATFYTEIYFRGSNSYLSTSQQM